MKILDNAVDKLSYDVHISIYVGDLEESYRSSAEVRAQMTQFEAARTIALLDQDIGYPLKDSFVPEFIPSSSEILKRETPSEVVQYPWRYYFSDVHYIPKVAFQQILPELFCRKRQNTFWQSLSLALTGVDNFCKYPNKPSGLTTSLTPPRGEIQSRCPALLSRSPAQRQSSPPQSVSSSRRRIQVEDYTEKEIYDSGLVRTPFVQHDQTGLPIRPTQFLTGYTEPEVPPHILNTPTIFQAIQEEILAMMNTGCWRWV